MSDEHRRERDHRRRGWAIAAIAVVLAWAAPAFSATTIPYVFQPNTPARASEINANFAVLAGAIDAVDGATDGRLDSVEARLAALEGRGDFVPSGTIAFFAAPTCPGGWSQYAAADGRYVVAAPGSGTASATVGTALGDREDRAHTHSIAHRHAWARSSATNRQWFSYTSSASGAGEVLIHDWGNGVGDGSGRWPLESERSATLYTGDPSVAASGTASTSQVAPYIQLRACQKD